MEVEKLDYKFVQELSKRDRAYIAQDSNLNEFIQDFPSIESLRRSIQRRSKYPVDRKLLVKKLREQHEKLNGPEESKKNIDLLLDKDTFTVTTAHQPSLFTGPLYFIYKILSVLKLSQSLNEQIGTNKIVPVFILGAEDHDFDEVNHLHAFNKTFLWDRISEGPTGRLSLEKLDTVYDEIIKLFNNRNKAEKLFDEIKSFLSLSENYGQFNLRLVNRIFGKYGLVTISMDDPDLKVLMIPAFKKELLESHSNNLVAETQKRISALGYKAQTFIRDINLFYMKDDFRLRIESDDNGFNVIGLDLVFSKEDMLNELEQHPERFSPNVVMRPIFQESVLPNIAYIGGGGELAYWMERKTQFESHDVFYPILIRRNSALFLRQHQLKKLTKLNLTMEDIFLPEDNLIKQLIINNSGDKNFNFKDQMRQVKIAYEEIAKKAIAVDPTLKGFVLAEEAKTQKNLEHISKKVEKRVKEGLETGIKQVSNLKTKLFPSKGLQERHENILAYLADYGEELIDNMMSHMDPLDSRFTIFILD